MAIRADTEFSDLVLSKAQVPPIRHGVVPRTDLLKRLEDESDRRLALVRAPAGFGKTTLLAQWAQHDESRRFGWVTLSPTENDPVMLWRYAFLALRSVVAGLANEAWERLQGPAPDIQAKVLPGLLNGLVEVEGKVVLVFDDYHLINNPACHETVQYLIDHLPRSTQIAIATREQPPLALSKVVVQGLELEISHEDLEFSVAETEQALKSILGSLSPDYATEVHSLTEGWATGVFLAAMSQERATARAVENTQRIRQYLMDEMLDGLSASDRDFLRQTSILDRFTPELCDYVSGSTDAAKRLLAFSEANLLLVPLDNVGTWYRYHHLFQEALLAEQHGADPAEMPALHQRAHRWWLDNGHVTEAIYHAIEAGDVERAADLVCEHCFAYISSGRLETTHRWLSRFSDDEILRHPPLILAAAWTAAFRGDAHMARHFARAAGQATYDGTAPDGTASYESSVAMLLAALALDGVTDARRHAETAYELEPADGPWGATAAMLAGATRLAVGENESAKTALQEAVDNVHGSGAVSSYALGQLALLAASDGDWAQAAIIAERACDLIERQELQDLFSSGAAYAAAAAAAAHQHDDLLTQRHLRAIAGLEPRLSDAVPWDAMQVRLVVAEIHLDGGNYRAAAQHAEAADVHLKALGNGGVWADRLEAVHERLEAADATDWVEHTEGPDPLTSRELQILALLPTMLSLGEIGYELYVSRNTVKTHTSRIYRKLNVSGRSEAVARARELGIL